VRVGIIQSNYLPWRGYFDFIASVDLFIFHDDLQYTKNDWRNRNRIKTDSGLKWLSVPVSYKHTAQLISDTRIDYSKKWWKNHINQFRENYQSAPCFVEAFSLINEILCAEIQTLSELNICLIKKICEYLGIVTPMVMSSEFHPEGKKTERLISILSKVGADTYVSGPSAESYLDKQLLHQSNIRLEYKTYNYAEYPQQHGLFENNVTILDLIANCGQDSRLLISSRTNNVIEK
jgi:hypothetical protein